MIEPVNVPIILDLELSQVEYDLSVEEAEEYAAQIGSLITISEVYGGLPSGGNAGEILIKNSDEDYDAIWGTIKNGANIWWTSHLITQGDTAIYTAKRYVIGRTDMQPEIHDFLVGRDIEATEGTPNTLYEIIDINQLVYNLKRIGNIGENDYNRLLNKPQIDGIEINKNSTSTSLGLATASALEEKYTKPSDGIPASDLAEGVIPEVHNIPSGGGAGQALIKNSNEDYDAIWSDIDSELPDVSSSDYGKVLTVSNDGIWNAQWPIFMVTITNNNNVFSADKTFSEITDAARHNMTVVATYAGAYYQYCGVGGGAAVRQFVYIFTKDNIQTIKLFSVNISNVWTQYQYQLGTYNKPDSGIPASDLANDIHLIPPGGDSGQVLKKISNSDYDIGWLDDNQGEDAIFYAIYDVTTSAEIEAAYQAGKAICCIYDAFGDTLIAPLVARNASDAHGFCAVYGETGYEIFCDNDIWEDAFIYNIYVKPNDGIPKSDLSSAVQNSLNKADTALQQHQDISGKLDKTGGTMSGILNMGSQKITNLAAGVNAQDAVNLQQVQTMVEEGAATYRGNFSNKNNLISQSWQSVDPTAPYYVDTNDFAIITADETHNNECWRYVYSENIGWEAEYKINDSPMSQAQLDALNSGITAAKVTEFEGKYDKPNSGIPKSDLASDVQTSLSKADTALQSFTETDPTVPSWAKASNKPSYTASEVGALPDTTLYAGSITSGGPATVANGIHYAQVDDTSTSTEYTASIPNINSYYDGLVILLKNGVVTSASGFTIDINNLGAKPVYSNMAAATRETTIFNINYTLMFIYDSTRVEGGCWINYRGYYTDANSIGYQIRGNNGTLPAKDKFVRYRLLFTSANGTHFVPATTSTSTNATSSREVNQSPIDPFGRIVYYSSTTTISAGGNPGATYLWSQYQFALGYSFNRTGAALVLDYPAPVYIKCAPQADGSAIIDSTTPYVQVLPNTADGKIYIFLGIAYNATNVDLYEEHPVYYHDGTGIRLWVGKTISSIPSGGSTGQVLKKASGTNYDTEWADESSGATVFEFLFNSNGYAVPGNDAPTLEEVLAAGDNVIAKASFIGDSEIYYLPLLGNEGSFSAGPVVSQDEISGTYFSIIYDSLDNVDVWHFVASDILPIPTKTSDLQNDSGFYAKPSSGIPASDLTSAVQTSLGKADTALQPGDVLQPFVVTYTQNGSSVTCDKTYSEIVAALSTPLPVVVYGAVQGLGVVAVTCNTSMVDGTGVINTILVSGPGDFMVIKHPASGSITMNVYEYAPIPAVSQGSTQPPTSDAVYDALATKYEKPSGGIPKTDLASAVQTSLGKADTAIPAPASPSSAQDLIYLNGAWVAADKVYIVNCTPTALDYSGTMDKTVAQIYAAYQEGKTIVFRLWTAVDSHFDTVGTMFWTSGNVTYPSFNAFIVLSDPYNSIVFAYTGATNNGAQATYGTNIYPLSTSPSIPAPSSPTTGDFLCWNGSAWAATSLSTWQGGNY